MSNSHQFLCRHAGTPSLQLYHATRVHLHEGFYKQESNKGMAVERIIELVTRKELSPEICLHLLLDQRRLPAHHYALASLEVQKTPSPCTVDNLVEDLRAYLEAGSTETSSGIETDGLLASLPATEKRKRIKSFQDVFRLSLQSHLGESRATQVSQSSEAQSHLGESRAT